MAFDIVSYAMGKAAGGGGGGGTGNYIQPAYQGLSYGYNVLEGTFWSSTTNNNFANVYELEANKTYLFSVGRTQSNRMRALYFNGKTYDNDFAQYVENPASSASSIYTADINVTGTTEITGSGIIERYYFGTSASGVLVVVTSNVSLAAPIYLGEIPNAILVPLTLTKGSYDRYNGTLTLVDAATKEYSFVFTGITGTSGYVEYASVDTGDTSGATKRVTFAIDGNWKNNLAYGDRKVYCYGSDTAAYATTGLAFSTAGTYTLDFTGRYLCWSFGNVDDNVTIDCSITELIVEMEQ